MRTLERMAKAMYEYDRRVSPVFLAANPWHAISSDYREMFRGLARVALEAARIPDGDTVDVLFASGGDELNVWTDGIDHILGAKYDTIANQLVCLEPGAPQ